MLDTTSRDFTTFEVYLVMDASSEYVGDAQPPLW
jgi:hypothetical protein